MQEYTLKTFKFFRPESQKWEDVGEEIWQWEALFNDGTVLKQFDEHGRFHQFKEIDQSKLRFFRMVSPIVYNKFVIDFDPLTMKLIHGYKRLHLVDYHNNEYFKDIIGDIKLYFFGYESKVQRGFTQKKKVINMIMPDATLITTNDTENIVRGLLPSQH